MTWERSTRRERLPAGWSRTRVRILRRDGYTCRVCRGRATDVDHVVRLGGEDDGNLQSLCGPCHRTKTAREASEARPRERRAAEQHPGLLP